MIEVLPEWVEVAGRKRIRITLRDGRQLLDADLIDPYQARQRRKASRRLAHRAGEPYTAERIEALLLQCMGQGEAAPKAEPAGGQAPLSPVDVVRPELIIMPQAVGISVGEVVIRDGAALGSWRIYLRLRK